MKKTRTEHPHIVRVEGVCGGRPVIDGRRISVQEILYAPKLIQKLAKIQENAFGDFMS